MHGDIIHFPKANTRRVFWRTSHVTNTWSIREFLIMCARRMWRTPGVFKNVQEFWHDVLKLNSGKKARLKYDIAGVFRVRRLNTSDYCDVRGVQQALFSGTNELLTPSGYSKIQASQQDLRKISNGAPFQLLRRTKIMNRVWITFEMLIWSNNIVKTKNRKK